MEVREVTPGFAVASQIQPVDMATLAREGYATVICNRPDHEESDQPTVEIMRAAAQEAGLAFHHIPVSGGGFPAPAVAAFRAVRRGSEGPVLAYCRTGTRSITLETLANPQGRTTAERLSDARAAGYDLSSLAKSLGD